MKAAKWILAGLALVLLASCVYREDGDGWRYGHDRGEYHHWSGDGGGDHDHWH